MSLVNNIVNEFDIALKTLSNKKSGTGRSYPADAIEANNENLTQIVNKLLQQLHHVNSILTLQEYQSILLKNA